MIVTACGTAKKVHVAEATMQATASSAGTAYGKKGVVKTVLRIIRKVVKTIRTKVRFIVRAVRAFMGTRTGKPTSIDPPASSHM